MNELKMCMYQCVYEGKRREKETDIIGVAQAFDSNPSLLMYLYLHTFILFPTFYFTFFLLLLLLLAENIFSSEAKCARIHLTHTTVVKNGLQSPHWASITVLKNEANISRVFFFCWISHKFGISFFPPRWYIHQPPIKLVCTSKCRFIVSKTSIQPWMRNEKWGNNQHHLNAYKFVLFKTMPNMFHKKRITTQTINNH